MSKMETVVQFAKHLETTLEMIGARGKGLHEKLDSMQHAIDSDLISAIRRVATVRNKLLHDTNYRDITDYDKFIADCIDCVSKLSSYVNREDTHVVKAKIGPTFKSNYVSAVNNNLNIIQTKKHANDISVAFNNKILAWDIDDNYLVVATCDKIYIHRYYDGGKLKSLKPIARKNLGFDIDVAINNNKVLISEKYVYIINIENDCCGSVRSDYVNDYLQILGKLNFGELMLLYNGSKGEFCIYCTRSSELRKGTSYRCKLADISRMARNGLYVGAQLITTNNEQKVVMCFWVENGYRFYMANISDGKLIYLNENKNMPVVYDKRDENIEFISEIGSSQYMWQFADDIFNNTRLTGHTLNPHHIVADAHYCYIFDNNNILCINSDKGTIMWKFNIGPNKAVFQHKNNFGIYATMQNSSQLVALNKSGKIRYNLDIKHIVSEVGHEFNIKSNCYSVAIGGNAGLSNKINFFLEK